MFTYEWYDAMSGCLPFDLVKSKVLNIALHIACWIVFLSIPHFFFAYVMHIVHMGHATSIAVTQPRDHRHHGSIWP
jgi:hypothetical protein